MLQEQMASCSEDGGFSWFFSSCSWRLGILLQLTRGTQGVSRGASGKSNLHASCEGILGVPLEPLQGNQDLSRVEWELGVLFPCSRILEVPLEINR